MRLQIGIASSKVGSGTVVELQRRGEYLLRNNYCALFGDPFNWMKHAHFHFA
jgi:hypothetical protein